MQLREVLFHMRIVWSSEVEILYTTWLEEVSYRHGNSRSRAFRGEIERCEHSPDVR